jgi:hypothetical protein
VFAKWSDDGSLDQAFIASVRHLAEQRHLDLSVLHGDGSVRPHVRFAVEVARIRPAEVALSD